MQLIIPQTAVRGLLYRDPGGALRKALEDPPVFCKDEVVKVAGAVLLCFKYHMVFSELRLDLGVVRKVTAIVWSIVLEHANGCRPLEPTSEYITQSAVVHLG